ncbi:hypothetical protein PFHG_05590 [Plasmodium falciparum HB3]|uniref:Uncharacterized protein n=1 Tax=Plasmodium falciparum (isolate HB3) TaxID=137071 RepID=A0A0L7KMW6_PLAFX|nr:hypothetical protein PFHG_05590 [Plasmodium falciparum HB3]
MCRGGGMLNPPYIWRRWGKESLFERKEISPNDIESLPKTKEAGNFLVSLGLKDEANRLVQSKKIRAGNRKMRNRKYKIRNGPLIIYENDNGVKKAFRNIPGVDLCKVTKLNLLKLAPGGPIGRLCIWSQSLLKN